MNQPVRLQPKQHRTLQLAAACDSQWILTLSCADRVGIVAAVSGFLADRDGFILDSQQFADLETGKFFMRVVFTAGGTRFTDDKGRLGASFGRVADLLKCDWSLAPAHCRPRVLIAASKSSHCVNDLLYRWRTGTLPVVVVGVVSNHRDLQSLVEWHDVRFHYLPVVSGSEHEQEEALLALFDAEQADLLVLARYMRILSARATQRLWGKCVNIHHSFLPSFKGARAYQHAHEYGVKLIGATAHFVNEKLDEGPIIEQAVERVDHRAPAEELAKIGRDTEARVLARAVAWVAERRVFLSGRRTIVFQ